MQAFAAGRAANPRSSGRFTLAMALGRATRQARVIAVTAFPWVSARRSAQARGHFRLAMPLMTGHSRERFRLTPVDGRITGEDEAILFGLRTTRFARRLHTL